MSIIRVDGNNSKAWAELCNELWPHHSVEELLADFYRGEYQNEYMYFEGLTDGLPIAFISLSIRNDYVEGKKDDNPVGYVEAIYVKPEHRKKGVASEMISFAKEWSVARDCTMLASDCELTNEESRLFHNKVGFNEESINVHFAMRIAR